MNKRVFTTAAIFSLLVGLIVVGRLMPHLPNFAPAAAAALFAGFLFKSRMLAVAVPVLGMAISDLLFAGIYSTGTMIVVYFALTLPAFAGGWLQNAKKDVPGWMKALRVFLATGAGSLLFFVASNLAVWVFDGMYALNFAGFTACFAAALPFFKWTLVGDLVFATTLFGTLALIGSTFKSTESKFIPA